MQEQHYALLQLLLYIVVIAAKYNLSSLVKVAIIGSGVYIVVIIIINILM